jgi:hypothetical protein
MEISLRTCLSLPNLESFFQFSIPHNIMPFTLSHSIGKVPSFLELKKLADEHGVQINGNDQAGDFKHPEATGKYTFEKNGEIHGEFAAQHVLGIVTGIYVILTGTVDVTITRKPFLMPEGTLKEKLSEGLVVFCAQFPGAS